MLDDNSAGARMTAALLRDAIRCPTARYVSFSIPWNAWIPSRTRALVDCLKARKAH
jgi:hypothetical protein